MLTDGGESEYYDEALQDENSSKWELAMKDEMDSDRKSTRLNSMGTDGPQFIK